MWSQNRLDRLVALLDDDISDTGEESDPDEEDLAAGGVKAAPNQGGDGALLPTACMRYVRRVAKDIRLQRRHRCAYAESGGAVRCHWCSHNNKTCEVVCSPVPAVCVW